MEPFTLDAYQFDTLRWGISAVFNSLMLIAGLLVFR
jgi:hypothetical protein